MDRDREEEHERAHKQVGTRGNAVAVMLVDQCVSSGRWRIEPSSDEKEPEGYPSVAADDSVRAKHGVNAVHRSHRAHREEWADTTVALNPAAVGCVCSGPRMTAS